MPNGQRIEVLDSIRGLASFSVVIHHTLIATPIFLAAHYHESIENNLVKVLTSSPLHVLWGGHEAVLLFFVLSGFVLSLPFLNQRSPKYSQYLIKRICRIYIPYILSIALSAGLLFLLNPSNISDLSDWFNGMWSSSITGKTIISSLLMLDYHVHNLNTVTWSLVHEMRISIIFPILIFFIIKYTWRKSLLIGIFLSLFACIANVLVYRTIQNDAVFLLVTSLSSTVYYTNFFIIGAVVAKHRHQIIPKIKRLNSSYKFTILAVSLALYCSEWIIPKLGYYKYNGNIIQTTLTTFILDLIIMTGIIILFTLVLSSSTFKKILLNRYLLGLGKISYSLYLVHIIVLLSIIHFFKYDVPFGILLLIVPIISVFVAILFYKYIEFPSISLANRIVNNKNRSDSKTIVTTRYSIRK
ncbi:acyltransferase [Paenibacillus sp. FSL F4-0243]|uniref:acyltransferase family protein n=1 Tax=Paenibacillus sp. FSL F4-0243 TaxID=2954732 RepID=UPI0030D8005D